MVVLFTSNAMKSHKPKPNTPPPADKPCSKRPKKASDKVTGFGTDTAIGGIAQWQSPGIGQVNYNPSRLK